MNDEELLDIIQAAAFEVRKHLCPGYLEIVYQNALLIELQSRGLEVDKEVAIPVYYKGHVVGDYRCDLLVEKRIIIELKATANITPIHEAQLVNYLVATNLPVGALVNYGADKFSFRRKTKDYIKKK
ncbi:MAG: GxxExxY protein [Bacteroidales bacterium]|nr:GxxExxY protein [Bacteroidales bacterium]